MTDLAVKKNSYIQMKPDVSLQYQWFYNNIFQKIIESSEKFFQRPFSFRFMSVSNDENILFYGDEYFVNTLPVTKTADLNVKISSKVVEFLLDEALGKSNEPFRLNNLTDIEAGIIKSYILHIYKSMQDSLNRKEQPKHIIQNSRIINFTVYVQDENEHIGKIIFRMPEYLIPEIKRKERKDTFTIDDFRTTNALLKLKLGSTKISLTEIKNIETGDIIVLENSDINKMSVVWQDNEVLFNINPDPSLIISISNNGGNEMEEETSTKSQNMWDSILVDVVAEFDNVKLTLGELKQISEGLVVDVGSVYDNKIKLRVENQVVATGELVILNDRYGVRIENVKKSKEIQNKKNTETSMPQKAAQEIKSNEEKQVKEPKKQNEGNENFDYSDFEIEDESI